MAPSADYPRNTSAPSQHQRWQKKTHRPSVAIGLWLIKKIERMLVRYSLVPDTPFFDNQLFDWQQQLADQADAIRDEVQVLLQRPERLPRFQDISRDQLNITRDDNWRTWFLYGYGYRFDDQCRTCPQTCRAVEAIPGMRTAFFSILAPGKQIPLHRGPYKGLLRCHLPVMVPRDRQNCWIEVGGERRSWRYGECLIFDDTYRHQVHNDTDEMRVVLFIDVDRPLSRIGRLINRTVIRLIQLSPYIQDARRNQRAWEKRLGSDD